MQAGEKKKLVLLAVMLGILAVIWGYRLFTGDERTVTGGGEATHRRRAALPPDKPVNVNIGLLDEESPKYRVGRNIFDPAYKEPVITPPVLPKKPATTVTAAPQPPPPPPPPPKTATELRHEKASAEMSKFKFLGFLKRSNRTDVFLALGNDYFVATKGEDITDGYYLKDIGPDSLLIADRESGAEASVKVDFREGEKSTLPIPGVSSGGSEETAPPRHGRQPAGRGGQRTQPPADEMPQDYGDEGYSPGYTAPGTGSASAPAALNNRSM